ncbi:hypothetical protein IGI04_003174 [Brassica rapa subsp. trilocularis]|uniref:FMP27 C-terminal domain-containing protein n=1 Tax=Brassica rapa subsp. trilocularis TaxID=1813537 RepID=A0ABQ7NXN5_BRACM|nr:hypothetical protein IGI04_003174 [Brassica rapa subsp. trilocularis]
MCFSLDESPLRFGGLIEKLRSLIVFREGDTKGSAKGGDANLKKDGQSSQNGQGDTKGSAKGGDANLKKDGQSSQNGQVLKFKIELLNKTNKSLHHTEDAPQDMEEGLHRSFLIIMENIRRIYIIKFRRTWLAN